jgi:cytidine deaminase
MLEKRLGDLEDWQRNLLGKAESVMHNSYNPYSHFYVGAAVLTQGGKIYLGTFAENSSQGMTICAEPAAILAANTDGERMFKAIAVIGAGETQDAIKPVAPCGRCRQIIYDFSRISQYNIDIICSNTKKDRIVLTSIEELYPLPFGPEDVGLDLERFRKRS